MRLTTHDPGYQPWVISANKPTWRAIYDKLCAYEDAEENGLLVRLPCKLGDTVYHIVTHSVDITGYRMEWKLETTVEPTAFRIWMVDAIGKTIFLQREEAEGALAALKGESYERT